VKKWKVALPLRPDFGVEPNVFYIPPLLPMAFKENGEFDEKGSRIPLEYLRELFGPGAEKALAKIESERKKAAAGRKSELIDILIARSWQQLLGPYTVDPGALERPPKK
jgi:ethylbenzene hydroxylase subunit beta/complex iron-sulfur molybdoenzyme family reductase subunit beta